MIGEAAHERKHRPRIVAGLRLHHRIIETASVDARRCAGLQAIHSKRTFAQLLRQCRGRRVARAAGRVLGLADMNFAGQKSAGGQHHGRREETQTGLRDGAAYRVVLDDQIVHRRLEHGQIRLRFHRAANEAAIEIAIGLTARGAHGWALRCIESSPLDAGGVRGAGHDPAQRIDFLDQVPLADAADSRVAAHRADRLDVVRQQ